MTGSSRYIDYALRPAKHIERKMLAEAFAKLSVFGSVDSYRYIGFGAIYFRDFYLFHKSLGIQNMVDIEIEVGNKPRYEFNRPYKCIELKFGHSNTILPVLPWNMRTILWLDYDGTLNADVLTDVRQFCTNPYSGSVIVVTVNAQTDLFDTDRLEQFKEEVGRDRVPADVEPSNLDGWGVAELSHRIVSNEIEECLNDVNGTRPAGAKFKYKQLFNFRYADGARMMTVGGLLYDEGQQHLAAQANFDQLNFVKSDQEPYYIEVPKLTFREIRFLDSHLPSTNLSKVKLPGVPASDIKRYAALYRYFPTFAETDI